MRRLLVVGAALLCLLSAGVFAGVAGAAPATWSFQRASFGLDAKAMVLTDHGARSEHFLPGAYFSWSAASNLSLAATVEREFASNLTIGQVGARVRVLDTNRGDIAGGVNAVFYGDEGAAGIAKPTSWNASVNGAWDAIRAKNGQTRVWAIASASWDPQNDIKILRAGLRLQLIGGVPIYEPEATQ